MDTYHRHLARLRKAQARVAYREKQVTYWARRKAKAKNPSPERGHARRELDKRRQLLAAARAQLAAERKIVERHRPRPAGVSEKGVAMIAAFEGFVDHVYRDAVGVQTIGYGETRRDIILKYLHSRISPSAARALLRQRLNSSYAPPVLALHLPTQNMIDATVSLVYNCGPGCIAPGTTIGNALRRKDWKAAADGFLLWNRAGGNVLVGLTRRREAERNLFLTNLPR